MSEELSIRYPRRILLRRAMKTVGRLVSTILTRSQVTGLENYPKRGPLIMVGNHAAFMEVAMMALHAPYPAELMGAGDIPLDPRYHWLADMYGFIRIRRGSMDREGLNLALDILKQDGVLGLFPEGGTWETTLRQARTGVAWLSSKANAPVLPIGFWGIEGALTRIGQLKRPRVNMNIGRLIPPIRVDVPGKTRKQALAEGANLIMERITDLIPEDERRTVAQNYVGETFDFQMIATHADGTPLEIPAAHDIVHKQSLSKFFHRPVLMDVFIRNLRMPVRVLNRIKEKHSPAAIAEAAQMILDYLHTNPYFFDYRFGPDKGAEMESGIRELRDVARWLADQFPGVRLQLRPIRRYTLIDTMQEVVEEEPPAVPEI